MKITVITVCFNSAEHIADALRSVDAQTWPDTEHLVIDGGSTDGTLDILRAHRKPWRRVVSEPDHGIYDAMNKGIALATGEVVGFLNSDDFFATPSVLGLVGRAFADDRLQASWGDLCYVKRDQPEKIVRYWRSSAFAPGHFARGWCPPHPTLYLRRSVLRRSGGFDLSYAVAADMELMARVFEVDGVVGRHIPQVLVYMRMGGASNRSWLEVLKQNRRIWAALHAHRLSPSLLSFVFHKLTSRGRQFLARPS